MRAVLPPVRCPTSPRRSARPGRSTGDAGDDRSVSASPPAPSERPRAGGRRAASLRAVSRRRARPGSACADAVGLTDHAVDEHVHLRAAIALVGEGHLQPGLRRPGVQQPPSRTRLEPVLGQRVGPLDDQIGGPHHVRRRRSATVRSAGVASSRGQRRRATESGRQHVAAVENQVRAGEYRHPSGLERWSAASHGHHGWRDFVTGASGCPQPELIIRSEWTRCLPDLPTGTRARPRTISRVDGATL